jgi:hypothetical protein
MCSQFSTYCCCTYFAGAPVLKLDLSLSRSRSNFNALQLFMQPHTVESEIARRGASARDDSGNGSAAEDRDSYGDYRGVTCKAYPHSFLSKLKASRSVSISNY